MYNTYDYTNVYCKFASDRSINLEDIWEIPIKIHSNRFAHILSKCSSCWNFPLRSLQIVHIDQKINTDWSSDHLAGWLGKWQKRCHISHKYFYIALYMYMIYWGTEIGSESSSLVACLPGCKVILIIIHGFSYCCCYCCPVFFILLWNRNSKLLDEYLKLICLFINILRYTRF